MLDLVRGLCLCGVGAKTTGFDESSRHIPYKVQVLIIRD